MTHSSRRLSAATAAIVASLLAIALIAGGPGAAAGKPKPKAKAVTLTLSYDGLITVTVQAKSANPKCYANRSVVATITPEGGGQTRRADFPLDKKGTSSQGFEDGTVTATLPAKQFKDVKCKAATATPVTVNRFP